MRKYLIELEQIKVERFSRLQKINSLLKRLPQIQESMEKATQIETQKVQFQSEISKLRNQENSAKMELEKAHLYLKEIRSTFNLEAELHEELSAFLVKLADMVKSADCPVCGRVFSSNEEAKKIIRDNLSDLPQKFKDISLRVDIANKDVNAKQQLIVSIQENIRKVENEYEKVNSRKNALDEIINEYLTECAMSGVTVFLDDISRWKSKIEEARKRNDKRVVALNAKIINIKKEIDKLLSNNADRDNTLTQLRRRLKNKEEELEHLGDSIQELNTELIRRDFKPNALPKIDDLNSNLSTYREKVEKSKELIVKIEAENRDAETTISKMQLKFMNTDESIASKNMQLKQYETIGNRYIEACNITGVDPQNPLESIQVVRQKIIKLDKILSILDDKNQILFQIVGLDRLKRDLNYLERELIELKQKSKECSEERSWLTKWVDNFGRLQSDVVEGQIDVVGTHIERLEPITQRIYRRLNPHPVFGNLKINIDEKTQELDFEAELSLDFKKMDKMAIPPKDYFSDAQMNLLAITVFIASAFSQNWSGFNTILIDDPIQQMDELNVYSFIDLIRGLSSQRQFIIFTCSSDFYQLAIERLTCLNSQHSRSFLAHRLEGIAPADLKIYCDVN